MEAFVSRFRDTFYADLARSRMEETEEAAGIG